MRIFPTYVLDESLRIRPGPETPRVNFLNLKDILLSTDLERNAELEWANAKNLRFLDGADMQALGQTVCFQSLPRTGNSFLRRIVEIVTGVYTGSDMMINLTLQMVSGNLGGEETVANSNLPWITKTHWPLESPFGATPFSAQKTFCVVRNPVDVMPSLALLMNTSSHSLTVSPPVNEADPAWWERFTDQLTTIQT